MTTRTPALVSVYNDGVVIYLGIEKGEHRIEIELETLAARILAATLLENINEINSTLTVKKETEG